MTFAKKSKARKKQQIIKTHTRKQKELLTLDCELPILVLRMLNIGHPRRTLSHHGKGAPLSSFVPFPFHITAIAFCMSVCRTVSTALRLVSFSVIRAIFRIIRVIVMVRYAIHAWRVVRAKRHWTKKIQLELHKAKESVKPVVNLVLVGW